MSEDRKAPQQPGPAPDQAGATASEISRRVGAILDAVEREAARLREEARVDADRYLEDARRRADALVADRQRRIAEISDELVAKSEAVVSRLDDAAPVRAGFENLVRALGNAAERLSREPEAASADFAASPRPRGFEQPPASPPIPVPAAAPSFRETNPPPSRPAAPVQPSPAAPAAPPAPPAPATRWRELDDARLIATQLAAAGSTRAEVGTHLRGVLGIADPGPTLDDIFGPGSSANARAPWGASRG